MNVAAFEGVDEAEESLWEEFLRELSKSMDSFSLFSIVWVLVFPFSG